MSIILKIAKKIGDRLHEKYIYSSTYRFFSFIYKIYKKTTIRKIIKTVIVAIKSSFFARWLKKPERNIDVFEGSKIVNKTYVEKPIEKGEKLFNRGFFGKQYKALYSYITKCPVRVVSLVVLGATLANIVVGLIMFPLEMFDVLTFSIKIIIILIALLGLNVKNIKKLKGGSLICKQFS